MLPLLPKNTRFPVKLFLCFVHWIYMQWILHNYIAVFAGFFTEAAFPPTAYTAPQAGRTKVAFYANNAPDHSGALYFIQVDKY